MRMADLLCEKRVITIREGVKSLPPKFMIGTRGLYLELREIRAAKAIYDLKRVMSDELNGCYLTISKMGQHGDTEFMLQLHGPLFLKLNWSQRSKMDTLLKLRPFDVDSIRAFVKEAISHISLSEALQEEEEADLPVIASMLYKLMRSGKPIFYVAPHEGKLVLREVHQVGPEERFSENAPSDIAGTPYTVVAFKPEGYYSWEKADIGDGWGNGTFGLPHVSADQWHIALLPSVQGRTDFVLGRRAFVNRWKLEHAGS
jgi:hypothetical protein